MRWLVFAALLFPNPFQSANNFKKKKIPRRSRQAYLRRYTPRHHHVPAIAGLGAENRGLHRVRGKGVRRANMYCILSRQSVCVYCIHSAHVWGIG